jgi:hypothetical protein
MANAGPFSIVMLFDDQANSLQTVQSLKEKGLDILTVNNASELIQMIAANKFDLVALSVNHASTTSLVQVLKIKTKVEVLVFGEDASPATSKAILKAGADYQVAGVISSYNLWLKIGHLVKDKLRHMETASRMLSGKNRSEDDSSAMIIKSSERSKAKEEMGERVSVIKSTPKPRKADANHDQTSLVLEPEKKEHAPKKEKKLLVGVKKKQGSIIRTSEEEVESASNITIEPAESRTHGKKVATEEAEPRTAEPVAKEKAPVKGKLMRSGKAENKAKKESPTPLAKEKLEKPRGKLTEEQLIDQEIDEMQNIFFANDQDGATSNGGVQLFDKDAVGNGKVLNSQKAEQQKKTTPQESASGTKKKNNEEESSYETEEDKIVSIEAARAHRKKQRELRRAEQKQIKNEAAKPATVHNLDKLRFKKQFREAVAKAGEKGFHKPKNAKSIGVVTKVSLIPVDNLSEKGFILMANSKNDHATVDEVSNFKGLLEKEMLGLLESQEFVLGDTYNIETFEVDFAAWAEKSSQFFHTYEEPETGKQVLICFLRKESLFPNSRKAEEYNMHRIELRELPPQTPVSFDAYLFLARNEKMLPYLRRGGSLTAKQVERLYRRGFKFLYIRDEEIRDYYSFYLSLYLNQDFRTDRKVA